VRVLLAAAILAGSFLLYTSNGETLASYDSAPTSLLAFNLLERHRLDLDAFRDGYFGPLGGGYAFTEGANGHLTSVFPIGTAIVALPIYTLFALVRHDDAHAPAITAPAFEPLRQRYEKLAAAAIAALSVWLFFLCACELAPAFPATTATAVYALGTSMWSIGSQALWQHGPVNLVVLAMVLAFVRASRARDARAAAAWIVAAGICAGWLPVIRPTAALFSLAALFFACRSFRSRAGLFAVALGLGLAPGIAWNAYFFHSLVGGYAGDAHAYTTSLPGVLSSLAALTVSPSRGLFVFAPVLAFALAGALRARRERDPVAQLLGLLALACTLLLVQYAFFRYWWAGYAYGPRFLTDVAAVGALLLVFVIPADPLAYARGSLRRAALSAAFGLAFLASVGVQFAGAYAGAAGSDWSRVPVSVDRNPERVWRMADSQIERNVRATYLRLFAWDLARSPAYDQGLAAHVTAFALGATRLTRGASIEATARFRNDGRSAIYGYDSGVFLGQLRMRVRFVDAAQRTASEQELYVRGSLPAGEQARAVGTIALPPVPGSYVLECEPFVVGGGRLGARTSPFRMTVIVG